jgi:uncharacterized protein (DUF2344 family)
MMVFVVKVNGHPRTYRTIHRAAWALTYLRGCHPGARITFKRVTLPPI